SLKEPLISTAIQISFVSRLVIGVLGASSLQRLGHLAWAQWLYIRSFGTSRLGFNATKFSAKGQLCENRLRMAKSRRRLTRRHVSSRRKRLNPLALDGLFDVLVNESYRHRPAEVIYHYTDWDGARGVLCSQHFWETAHDCTNDEAELVSAHSVIIEVADTLRKTTTGAAARALDLFINSYPRLQVNKLKTIYLACFTLARDDQEQWRRYADNGRGLCLGLRILNEPVPTPKNTGSA